MESLGQLKSVAIFDLVNDLVLNLIIVGVYKFHQLISMYSLKTSLFRIRIFEVLRPILSVYIIHTARLPG